MPVYQYVAKDIGGGTFRGTLEAETLDAFYRLIKERGQFCLSVHRQNQSKNLDLFAGRPLHIKTLSVLCRQFCTMLQAGLPIIQCLNILYDQAQDKRLKTVLLGVYESVQHGESLSHAMAEQKDSFPLLMRNMVAAGEAGGSLEKVLARLADQYEKENSLNNKIRQAMVYPIFLSVMMVVVVAMLLTFVMPTFLNLYTQTGSTLPATTKVLLAISTLFSNYWYLLAIGIVAVVLAIRLLLRQPEIRLWWDTAKLHLPVIGKLMLTIESARFARTLSSLVNSGLQIIQSLEIVEHIMSNHQLKKGIAQVRDDVRRGISLSAGLRKLKLFPDMLCSMLNVGEESGNLDEILEKTASFYDEEAESAIQRMVGLLEPVMIIVLAAIVGFIVISIITPIYSLYGQISNSGGAGLN